MNEQYKNNLCILQSLASASALPCVHELMSPIKSVVVDTKVLDMLILFNIYSELAALSVLDNGKFTGLITRQNYLNQIPSSISKQLFINSSLKNIIENDPSVFFTPLIISVDDCIGQVVLDLLTLDMKIDILPVRNAQDVIGIVKFTDMTLKLFHLQHAYIHTVTQTSTRLRNEIENAVALQRNLLRPTRINLSGLRGLVTSITCSEIGGDFYDYYAIDDRWIVLLVGDVSGHGVASGTIVSVVKATVNLIETDKEIEPHKILTRLSNTILKTANQSLLMTLFAACLDTQTGKLCYANAGHQFPYHYRSTTNQLKILEKAVGLPLGKEENIIYEQYDTKMAFGDRLFIYTDAIVEEESPSGECFGYDRLEEVLTDHIKDDSEYLRDTLLERLTSYIERCDFTDDVTLFHVEFYEYNKWR